MSRSKDNLPHIIEKRRRSGAYGPYLDGIIPPEGLSVKATATYQSGPKAGRTVLAMENIPDNTDRWSKNLPVIFVVVPGTDYHVGQILTMFPLGTQRAKTVFSKKNPQTT